MCKEETCKECGESLEGLRCLYVAIRDHHQGKLPPQLQVAYEKAGGILKTAVLNGCIDMQAIRRA